MQSSGVPFPPEYNGGIGDTGVENLRAFAEAGGILLAFNKASGVIVEKFDLGVKDVLAGATNKEFYCPGSILKVSLDTTIPIAFGMDVDSPVWFEQSPTFELGLPPGEAEGNFGEALVVIAGVEQRAHFQCFDLPYSDDVL